MVSESPLGPVPERSVDLFPGDGKAAMSSPDSNQNPRKTYAIACAKAYLEGLKSGHPFFTVDGFHDHLTFKETWHKGVPIEGLTLEDIGMTLASVQATVKEWRISRAKAYFDALKAGAEGCTPTGFSMVMRSSHFDVSLTPKDIGTTRKEIVKAVKDWMIPRVMKYLPAIKDGAVEFSLTELEHQMDCYVQSNRYELLRGAHLTFDDIGTTAEVVYAHAKTQVVRAAREYFVLLQEQRPHVFCSGLDAMMYEKEVVLTPEDIGTTAAEIEQVKAAYLDRFGVAAA